MEFEIFGANTHSQPCKQYGFEYMLFFDVNNGIARRSWARNDEAIFAIKREMERTPGLKVTLPNLVDDDIIENL